jgi:molybdopterin synthase catalytic subunit
VIRVQRESFDIGAEIARLSAGNTRIGGIASFVGVVRDFFPDAAGDTETAQALTLEHYPGMTERELAKVEAEANRRWSLEASLIIHRHGRLELGEPIVLVATASGHREAALESCAFLIDWLKTKAPFWKLEETEAGSAWVDARDSDLAAAAAWQRDDGNTNER